MQILFPELNIFRLQMWNNQLTDAPATIKLGLEAAEALPAGSDRPWLCWRSLNRLRTGIECAKTAMRRWGYIDNTQSVNCGEPQAMAHCCRLLDEPYITVAQRAKARKWQYVVRRMREKNKIFRLNETNSSETSGPHKPISALGTKKQLDQTRAVLRLVWPFGHTSIRDFQRRSSILLHFATWSRSNSCKNC